MKVRIKTQSPTWKRVLSLLTMGDSPVATLQGTAPTARKRAHKPSSVFADVRGLANRSDASYASNASYQPINMGRHANV